MICDSALCHHLLVKMPSTCNEMVFLELNKAHTVVFIFFLLISLRKHFSHVFWTRSHQNYCFYREWHLAPTLIPLKLLSSVLHAFSYLLLTAGSAVYVGLLWVLGMCIRRLRERASRSTASPTVPPNSFLEVRPSMLPLYHMTQPAKDRSTRRAPEYTNRSPKSWPWISRGAKTPSSRDVTPSRSISTANTRASLQWDKPSYLVAIAGQESTRVDVRKWSDRTSEFQSNTQGELTCKSAFCLPPERKGHTCRKKYVSTYTQFKKGGKTTKLEIKYVREHICTYLPFHLVFLGMDSLNLVKRTSGFKILLMKSTRETETWHLRTCLACSTCPAALTAAQPVNNVVEKL